jgi:hypothetical protein
MLRHQLGEKHASIHLFRWAAYGLQLGGKHVEEDSVGIGPMEPDIG